MLLVVEATATALMTELVLTLNVSIHASTNTRVHRTLNATSKTTLDSAAAQQASKGIRTPHAEHKYNLNVKRMAIAHLCWLALTENVKTRAQFLSLVTDQPIAKLHRLFL